MGRYVYVVSPFIGSIKGKQTAKDVGDQLQALINQYAQKGWEFCSVSEVNIEVSPGCIAALFGQGKKYTKFNQVIFRRPLTEQEEKAAG